VNVIDRVRGQRRPLSPREREVLRLMASGYTRAETAERLGISETTVRTHVTRIFAALAAVNGPHAVAIGFREGMLS
jgi:LuxR family transcriptional regulator, quorum-sensing system regulator RaiR